MTRIVSQDELDVLLATSEEPKADNGSAVYDFRRPDRITKEQLRSLHFLHDRFAHNIATSLSAYLRATTEVSIITVDQLAYGEFLTSLPDPTAYYAVSMQPLETLMAVEINPIVAFSMVDRMLGGTGDGKGPDRPLTEIEQNVVDAVFKLLMEHLTETWRAVGNVQFNIHGRETRPQMLQVIGRNEIVVIVAFLIKVAGTRGTLKLCIPASAIEAIGDTFSQAWARARRQPNAEEAARLATNLGRVPLEVTAQLSTTVSARELVALRPGDILSLGHKAGHPVIVSVADLPAYMGQLVVQNGSLAVRVEAEATNAGEGAAG
jgi:flagellar motor switch protein FliM